MAKKRLNASIKRSRTRSGCLTCRDRHVKCDEQQPVCKNCIKLKRKCYRGIRLNFTQYTIYNPSQEVNNNLKQYQQYQNFKLLDQSITIASLYENGKKLYEPYLYLHNKEDLKESDLQYQQDICCSISNVNKENEYEDIITTLPSSTIPTAPAPVPIPASATNLIDEWIPNNNLGENFDNTSILENFDITNYLLQESNLTINNLNANQQPIILNEPINKYNIDINKFINLIQYQKYYWLLDLFNELFIWKSIIPSYCLKLTEIDNQNEEYKLLINCLLNCSINDISLTTLKPLLNQQLNQWNQIKNYEINQTNYKKFERLLISIVFLFLNILITIQKNKNFELNYDGKIILNNQSKFFNQIIKKYEFDYVFKSIITISSIHSIIILKFFINKEMKLKFDKDINDDDNDDINYNDENPTLNSFIKLNDFEISNLNSNFIKFEFDSNNFPQNDSPNKLESFKLRQFIWLTIKLDYIDKFPIYTSLFNINLNLLNDFKNIIDFTSVNNNDDNFNILLPNDQGILINLLNLYCNKLINSNDSIHCNDKINNIFKIIENSKMELDIKDHWLTTFNWLLD